MNRLSDLIERCGYRHLFTAALEVVLFGSRATRFTHLQSDWDILIVGEQSNNIKTETCDITIVTPRYVESREFLESEIANHISRYGCWLLGAGTWRRSTEITSETIDYKRKKINSQIHASVKNWKFYNDQYRRDHVEKIRRDIQRLDCLQSGKPSPPKQVLDKIWNKRRKECSLHDYSKMVSSKIDIDQLSNLTL